MKYRGIFSIMAALVLGLAQRGARLLGRDILHDKRESNRRPRASKIQGRGGHAGSKLAHNLLRRPVSAAGWTDRKTRRYALRGYGYQAPPSKAGEVECAGTKRKTAGNPA